MGGRLRDGALLLIVFVAASSAAPTEEVEESGQCGI